MSEAVEVAATGAAAAAIGDNIATLVDEKFASRLFAQDATLWGAEAESEASIRLSWTGLHKTSRPLLGQIRALRDELTANGADHIVLCGMGGSSLAPEVICATYGVELTVLDSSDPSQVAAAVADRLDRTAVVVSSKSGSTVETDSHRRIYEAAFRDAGIDPASRIVVVTDPGSPLDKSARDAGYHVVNADPHVGGRYSALTAFGLVPSGLAGADIEALLEQADEIADLLAEDDDFNLGLRLGAALGGSLSAPGSTQLRDKIVFNDEDSGVTGFADWAEQLIAESTGKHGLGLLPVVVDPTAPELTWTDDDLLTVNLVGSDFTVQPDTGSELYVSGPLGAQFLLWEVATAVAGRLLGIDPFDQPDVESAKQAARDMLDGSADPEAPTFVDGPIEVRATPGLVDGIGTIEEALTALLATVPEHGYLAVMVYLDRVKFAGLSAVRRSLAHRLGRPVTFGWGPRFLHSTGQLHKGGPSTGVYLQITGQEPEDLAVPDRTFTLGQFIASQAAGDASVLAAKGRPVLRLHLTDLERALPELRAVLG